jgi:uncharacterized protein (DUF58 family)
MNIRLRLNVPLLPILVALFLTMQLIDPSRIWKILLIGLAVIWLIAYIWARSLQKNLYFQRDIRFGWAQVGDSLEERFILRNDGEFPATWVELVDQSTLPGYSASIATGVDSHSENSWYTTGNCKRRGLYWLGGTTVITGDPLGIYSVTITDDNRAMLMVMPPVLPLPQIEITPGGYMGEGRPRPNSPEHTVGAAGVREYQAGDSLKSIHWPTTARRNTPFVRLFDGAPAGDWWIVLDLDKKVQSGTGENSTEEHAIILAASLATRGLQARQAVGMVASSPKLTWLAPRHGEAQKWEILRELALIETSDTPLAELLERIRPSLGRRSTVVLITASTQPDWINALAPLLWRGIVPTVLLQDPLSFGAHNSMAAISVILGDMGIARHIITRDMLDRPEARPGHRGQWDWRVTPTGRAIPVHTGDTSWRRLGQ